MKKNLIFVLAVGVVVAAVIWFAGNKGNNNSLPPAPDSATTSADAAATPVAQAVYNCDGGKTIRAEFYEGDQKTVEPGRPPLPAGSVKIVLSDGRNFDLPQTISADGGRYANPGELFVFWDKGGTALVLENGKEIDYTGCVAAVQTKQ